MRTSIATISVGGSLEEKLDAIAGAGFDGVEIMDADLVATELTPADVRTRCADLGLIVEIFQPVRDVAGIDPALFESALRRFRRKLDWAVALGTSHVLVCSTVGPQSVGDRSVLVDQLRRLGDAAAERGIQIAYEALSWGTHVSRIGQAWDAVRTAEHAHVGLGVDTFHIAAAGDGPEALTGIPGEAMAFLQIADAPYLQMAALEWSRHHRCFPGQGALDVAGMVGAVLDAGYDGPLSLEVFSDLVREARPERTARDALRSLLYLQESLAERAQVQRAQAAGAQVPRAQQEWPPVERAHPRQDQRAEAISTLVSLPAAARRARAVQVDLSAAPDVGMPAILTALGFASTAPGEAGGGGDGAASRGAEGVSTWRHGAVTVRLGAADAGSTVRAIGVATDDPETLAGRAAALLWPVLETEDGITVEAPSGVRVRLLTTGTDPESGGRAQEYGAPSAPDHNAGLLGIDHVGTRLHPDDSDAEVSFYRQLFGMQAGPVSEFPDPAGRLRSRDLRTEDATMRTVLNIAVRQTRPGESVPTGVNQLAFATVDLLGSVETMRPAGAPLLRPPAGYYEDLDARFDLDPALLERLRTSGVFYDRDQDGGELLHVYTPVIGGSFYIEILERRGGYDDYGSAATPVRLAMQARRHTSPAEGFVPGNHGPRE